MTKTKKSLGPEMMQIKPLAGLTIRPDLKGEFHVVKAVGDRLIAFGLAIKFKKPRQRKIIKKDVVKPQNIIKKMFAGVKGNLPFLDLAALPNKA